MSIALELLDTVMPACATFGVLFLVINGKTERHTKMLRYVGAVMVGVALTTTWLAGSWQKSRISLLEQRVGYLEANKR
jgi:hypothetical protein